MKHLLNFKLFESKEIKKELPKIATPRELKKRWDKKRSAISELQNNIISLRRRVNKDMDSDNEKTMIVATIVRIIDKTGERVGNEESMNNGHFGVSHLMKKHIKVNGDDVTLEYVGKSGVEHKVTINDDKVARNLKQLLKINNGEVFVTSDGLSIKNTQVNRYLEDFNITSKALRGFKVNKMMSERLRKLKKPETESEIKKVFNEVLRKVAEEIGHTPGICRKNYLLPEIEKAWYSGKEVPKI
jgi:DNA topoisomerase-1